MTRIAKVAITESIETLLVLSTKQVDQLNYHKVRALYLLKAGEVSTLKDVAEALGYSVETIRDWVRWYKQSGINGLLTQSSRTKAIPEWAIERLRQELKIIQLLPSVENINAWLLTIGVETCADKAATLRAWMKIFLDSNTESSPVDLLIEPDLYARYRQWQQEHGLSSDAETLTLLLCEFFELSTPCCDHPPIDSEPPRSLQTPESSPKVPALLKQTDLAKRLGVTDTILKNNRKKQNFPSWVKLRDPESVSWQWIPSLRRYQSLPPKVL